MFEEAIAAIVESSKESSIYIGTDSIRFRSKRDKKWYARYATVVVLHKDSSSGARYWVLKEVNPDGRDEDKGTRMARLLKETELTVKYAQAVLPHCGERYVEIHLDVNPDPETGSNIACNASVGWVTGALGIAPKVKNQAWAATHAADHACRE